MDQYEEDAIEAIDKKVKRRGRALVEKVEAAPTPPSLSVIYAALKSGARASDIAKLCGVTEKELTEVIRKYQLDPTAIQAFKKERGEMLANVQRRIVESIDPEVIERASLRDRATAFNVFHAAERLTEGKSTANLAVEALTMEYDELTRQEEKLMAELRASGVPV
jgi:hypothetical protein